MCLELKALKPAGITEMQAVLPNTGVLHPRQECLDEPRQISAKLHSETPMDEECSSLHAPLPQGLVICARRSVSSVYLFTGLAVPRGLDQVWHHCAKP